MPYDQASQTFAVARATVGRWRKQQRTTGSLVPRTSPGRPPVVATALAGGIRALIAADPDGTLAEHAAQWAVQTGQRVSPSSIHRATVAAQITRKKRA
jgi:transposase